MPTLRFVTYLAPNMRPVYEFIAHAVAQRLGVETELFVGEAYEELVDGRAQAGFICGSPYTQLVQRFPNTVEPLAAPVLKGERFAGRPVYFSDVIVRRDAPFTRFEDLRGQAWAYNEPSSQSGYNLTIVSLLRRGLGPGFFGKAVQSGAHQNSIQMVVKGEVDGSAIDCQVLMVEMRARPELAEQIKVIDVFGPSTIQPLAVSTALPESLRSEIRALVTELHHEPAARKVFEHGFIEQWVAVNDASYDDIRQMWAEREAARFHAL